ncbi:MAG: 50S ribosomal protein L10 [Clostridiales bacterium]|nr:50S ribosomal protein L10 [Clostridiales bacterium]
MGSREEKEQMVAGIKEKLDKAQSVILADYRGVTVKEFTGLRAQLRNADVDLQVMKNTLGKIAAEQSGVEDVAEYLTGPTVWAFSMGDPASAAKILKEFARTHPHLVLKGGILEKKGFGPKMAETLADLPSREALLAQVAGLLQSPLTGLVRVLQGPINKFGYALEDYRKTQEKSA